MGTKKTKLGSNRTGMQMSPIDSGELLQGSERSMPTSEGDEQALAAIRKEYIEEADPVGTIPPPGSMKGVLKSGAEMLSGNRPQVLIDKLGERLAFERGGTRLWQALITKCEARDEGRNIVSLERANEICAEELRHFELVRRTIERMGADPTAQTPCADIVGVESIGLVQVLSDPRTTVAQCMSAILTAELTDNAGWDLLIALMRDSGQDDAVIAEFEQALAEERQHLETVSAWMAQLTLTDAKLMATS